MNIFGMPLFHGYYTIHDMENNRLGYVPTNVSGKRPLESGIQPLQTLDKKGKASKIVIMTTIITAMSAGLTLAYWYGVKPGFEWCIPDNNAVLISLSVIYFACIGLFEVFVIEPVLRDWLKLGIRAASQSQETVNIVRAALGIVAAAVYLAILSNYRRVNR